MKFSKRHYEAIAKAIKSAKPNLYSGDTTVNQIANDSARDTYRKVAYHLADMLAQDNPNFRYSTFLQFCGYEQ